MDNMKGFNVILFISTTSPWFYIAAYPGVKMQLEARHA